MDPTWDIIGVSSSERLTAEQPYPWDVTMDSPFVDYSGLVLANIDITNVIGHASYLAKQMLGQISYCAIGVTGGQRRDQSETKASGWERRDQSETKASGWVDYIQWRRPEAYGFLISSRDFDYDDRLDFDRFTIYYGEDNTGNVSMSFADYVRSIQPDGVDIALSQTPGSVALQVCLRCLKRGGNCVISYSQEDMPLFSSSFAKSMLFRPLSEPNSLYMVGIGYQLGQSNMQQGSIPNVRLNALHLHKARSAWNIPDTIHRSNLSMSY